MAISLAPAMLEVMVCPWFSAEQLVEFRESLARNIQAARK